jgi:hypothetical protein
MSPLDDLVATEGSEPVILTMLRPQQATLNGDPWSPVESHFFAL